MNNAGQFKSYHQHINQDHNSNVWRTETEIDKIANVPVPLTTTSSSVLNVYEISQTSNANVIQRKITPLIFWFFFFSGYFNDFLSPTPNVRNRVFMNRETIQVTGHQVVFRYLECFIDRLACLYYGDWRFAL